MATERTNWIWRLNRDGKRIGDAHLIGPDPDVLTVCGIRVDANWESIGVGGSEPDPLCERCAGDKDQ